ncbi:MAG: ribonuclease H-like domain-containing protein [Pirellulales bacterium]
MTTDAGEHWLIRQSVATLWPAFDEHFVAWQSHSGESFASPTAAPTAALTPTNRASARAQRYAAEVDALAHSLPRGTLFLDLETCGLAGSALFLIGLLRHDGKQLMLEQLLARNYAEEQAVLHTLWQTVAQATLLVTFNGKSFDWPLVNDRTIYHRIDRHRIDRDSSAPAMDALPHVDVLHHARRRWRHRLPDCRLQTLERFLCGRHRSGDIVGRDIPEAYRQYVATGRLDQIQAIVHHNALDLVTLLQLAMQLTRQQRATIDASAPLVADDAA